MIGPFGLASARADEAMIEGCLKAAAELHQVPAGVLVLLLSVEDGRLGEVSQNTNRYGRHRPHAGQRHLGSKDRRALARVA